MGGVTSVGRTCGPQVHGSSDGATTTVMKGERTIGQVAKRLKVSEEDLKTANPQIKDFNKLQAGQDLCLPEKSDTKTTGQPADSNKSKSKIPEGRIGDYRVPLPKPTLETDDTYDRGGTSSNRKDEQDRLDRSRPRDERDLDPKQIKEMEKEKLKPHIKAVDDQLKKGFDEAEGKNTIKKRPDIEREQMDDLIRNQKLRLRR